MSTLSAWSYEAVVTVWPASSYDAYGQPTFGAPYTLMMDYESGGDLQMGVNGNEFVSRTKYYFELALGSPLTPLLEGYILVGDFTATASPVTVGAEQIKKVTNWPMKKFGANEIHDWLIIT